MKKIYSTICTIIMIFSSVLFSLQTVYADEHVSNVMDTNGQINVTKGNFEQYFNLNGSTSYDQNTGIVTLTEDIQYQTGNFTLKNKIDMSQSFNLKGKVNLGNKSQGHLGDNSGGADGLGFVFNPGSTTEIGADGNAMGIGGLTNAFGFKLDTFFNKVADNGNPTYNPDPAEFEDVTNGWGHSFGSFVYTGDDKKATVYTGTDASAVEITEPSSNDFNDIEIDYDGTTKTMTISYDNKIWSKDVSSWTQEKAYAFLISASTGHRHNLQQFQIESFDYIAYGVANTKYIDSDTNQEIAPSKQYEVAINEEVSMAADVNQNKQDLISQDYIFDKVEVFDATSFNANDDAVKMTTHPNVITYYFHKVQTGDVTANYIDEQGNVISDAVNYNGKVGDGYETEQKLIDGYTFKEMQDDSASTSGQYTTESQVVTYVYSKNPVVVIGGDVTANYIDEQGNVISDTIIYKGNVGEGYKTEKKLIDGYTFKEIEDGSASEKGQFIIESQTVTYIYTKVKTSDDNQIAPPVDTHPGEKDKPKDTVNALPETGESNVSNLMMFTGIILIGISLITIGKFKKNQ